VRGARIYYTAHFLLAGRQPLEAFALFERAEGALSHAAADCADLSAAAHAKTLAALATKFKCVSHHPPGTSGLDTAIHSRHEFVITRPSRVIIRPRVQLTTPVWQHQQHHAY
jgi:hypothetical protein